MARRIRKAGNFCWINMLTPRPETALGGKVFVPLLDVPGIGRFCGITSPQGVHFYVISYIH